MSSDLNAHCVAAHDYFAFKTYHEIINVILCIFIIWYIARSETLFNNYKSTLLPLLIVWIVRSCAFAVYNQDPYANCYDKNEPLLVTVSGTIFVVPDILKQFLIMHFLIRNTFHKIHYSIGITCSLIIPIALSIVPLYARLFKHTNYDVYWAGATIMCISGLANFAISLCLILIACVSSFPIIIAVYECLYSIPETIKHYITWYGTGYTSRMERFKLVNDIDDFAFFITAAVTMVLLVRENSRINNSNRNDCKSFDNEDIALV